jgi:4-amino-4-deoxy-L-arabinose transferase-like glycosyltransferase
MTLSGFCLSPKISEKSSGFWNFVRSERAFIWRAFSIALILRLVPVLMTSQLGIGLDDMFQYDMLGRSIVQGNGFRWYAQPDLDLIQKYVKLDLTGIHYDPRGIETAFRAPLYPAFLALVYFFVGTGPGRFFAVRLAQALLNALLIPLTYFLARRLFPEKPAVARLAAWAVAFYPILVVFPLALATENLFFILLIGFILTLVIAAQTRRMRYFVLSGVLIGLTALTRSIILPAGALAVLWAWFLLRERVKAVALLAAILVVIAPWIVRNSLLYGRLTSIELSMGYNLYVGYHPQSTGTFIYGPSLDLLTIADDVQRERVGTEKAIEFIKADPGRFWYLAARRAGYLFGLERRALTYFYTNDFFGYIPFPLLLMSAILFLSPFVIVSCSAAFGLALIRWDRSTLILPLVIAAYTLPHIFLLADDRLHFVLVPLFAVLAALCWVGGRPALRARWQTPAGRWALALAALAVVLLVTTWGLELYRDADKLSILFGPTGNTAGFPY